VAQPTEAQRQAFERLRRTYIARMPARLDAIRRGVARAERGYDWTALGAVLRLVHRLTGSSGIFGLGGVSAAARALEERITGLLALDGGLRPRPRGDLAALVEALERAASQAAASKGTRSRRVLRPRAAPSARRPASPSGGPLARKRGRTR
jgi:HPt (histidine-containing phosphotransfer) domain-containing protein